MQSLFFASVVIFTVPCYIKRVRMIWKDLASVAPIWNWFARTVLFPKRVPKIRYTKFYQLVLLGSAFRHVFQTPRLSGKANIVWTQNVTSRLPAKSCTINVWSCRVQSRELIASIEPFHRFLSLEGVQRLHDRNLLPVNTPIWPPFSPWPIGALWQVRTPGAWSQE